MRFVVVLLCGLVGCGGCTKANPNQCCTDQADCSAHGIPNGTNCDQGLVCRGNQCIAEVCTGSSDCDLSAPFCVDTMCSATCTTDTQCPGNGGSAADAFCVGGSCVMCRAGGTDCPASAPVCDSGTCRGCIADADCSSAACDRDSGMCLDETKIVYAAPAGSATSDCAKASPCSLNRAFAMADASRPNLKLSPGTYTTQETFTGTYTLSVYGPATADGFIVQTNGGGLRLRDLDVTYNVTCEAATSNGAMPSLDVARVKLTTDFSGGQPLGASQCQVHFSQFLVSSTVTNAGQLMSIDGGGTGGSIVTIDRSSFIGGDPGLFISDHSSVAITNSVFSGQPTKGAIQLQTGSTQAQSGTISFSTFHNSPLVCPTGNVLLSFSNNIFLNEAPGAPPNTVSGMACGHSFDLIKPQSTSVGANNLLEMDPRFVNAASGDYHLMTGSPAVDAADPAATLNTDYDGTARPQGAGRDIGAFEYKP